MPRNLKVENLIEKCDVNRLSQYLDKKEKERLEAFSFRADSLKEQLALLLRHHEEDLEPRQEALCEDIASLKLSDERIMNQEKTVKDLEEELKDERQIAISKMLSYVVLGLGYLYTHVNFYINRHNQLNLANSLKSLDGLLHPDGEGEDIELARKDVYDAREDSARQGAPDPTSWSCFVVYLPFMIAIPLLLSSVTLYRLIEKDKKEKSSNYRRKWESYYNKIDRLLDDYLNIDTVMKNVFKFDEDKDLCSEIKKFYKDVSFESAILLYRRKEEIGKKEAPIDSFVRFMVELACSKIINGGSYSVFLELESLNQREDILKELESASKREHLENREDASKSEDTIKALESLSGESNILRESNKSLLTCYQNWRSEVFGRRESVFHDMGYLSYYRAWYDSASSRIEWTKSNRKEGEGNKVFETILGSCSDKLDNLKLTANSFRKTASEMNKKTCEIEGKLFSSKEEESLESSVIEKFEQCAKAVKLDAKNFQLREEKLIKRASDAKAGCDGLLRTLRARSSKN